MYGYKIERYCVKRRRKDQGGDGDDCRYWRVIRKRSQIRKSEGEVKGDTYTDVDAIRYQSHDS